MMVKRSYEFELDQVDYASEDIRTGDGLRVVAEYMAEWLPGAEEVPPSSGMYEQVLLEHVPAEILSHPHGFRFESVENGSSDPVCFGALTIYEKVAA